MQHKIYYTELAQEAFISRVHGLTLVENDRPMIRFMFSPFVSNGTDDGTKPLCGSIGASSFKLWENSWFWSGAAFTYIHGVWSTHGSGVRLIMRPRRSPILKVLVLLPLLAVVSFYWSLRDDFPGMTLLGQLVVPLIGLVIGFCFWLPLWLVHRVQSRGLIQFLQKELGLKEADS